MNKLFLEFENENSLRTYPFASFCTTEDENGNAISTDILIDAILYPVNLVGSLYLSSIAPGGIFNISDSTGIVMTATLSYGSRVLDFYDTSVLTRHAGTLLASSAEQLSLLASTDEIRRFAASSTSFAATCILPVVNDGVTSMSIGGLPADDGLITFTNTANDTVRVSTDGSNLRFDVVPDIKKNILSSIQHIYCIVDGKTPFRIQKMPFDYGNSDSEDLGNTVVIYLDNIDRGSVCSEAHRETTLEMRDTCAECESSSDCTQDIDSPIELPSTYQTAVVDIPHSSENAFYLTVPNMLGYDNPLSISMTDGIIVPKLELKINEPTTSLEPFTDTLASKGIILHVPGLSK